MCAAYIYMCARTFALFKQKMEEGRGDVARATSHAEPKQRHVLYRHRIRERTHVREPTFVPYCAF